MENLIGRTIKALFVNSDQSILVMDTDQGTFAYQTYGDCCSETWFADIIGVVNLLPYQDWSSTPSDFSVLEVETLDLPDPNDARGRQERDLAYGIRLKTARGHTDIVYRNSSNGYYGGEMLAMGPVVHDGKKILSVTRKCPYDGTLYPLQTDIEEADLEAITGDWSV